MKFRKKTKREVINKHNHHHCIKWLNKNMTVCPTIKNMNNFICKQNKYDKHYKRCDLIKEVESEYLIVLCQTLSFILGK